MRVARCEQQALGRAARVALGNRDVPLPASVTTCLAGLSTNQFRNLDDAAYAVDRLAALPDRVPSSSRANTLLLSAATFGCASLAISALQRTVGAVAPGLAAALPVTAWVGVLCTLGAALSAWFSGGGVWLASSGITVVSVADAAPASRAQCSARAVLAWSWVLIPWLSGAPTARPQVLAAVLAALIYAASNPTQGPIDRLTGTRLVPR